MPGLRTIGELANLLQIEGGELDRIARNVGAFCEDLELIDPAKPGKVRDVVNVREPLRSVQTDLLRYLLGPNLRPSIYSHGGIAGRSIATNAEPHRKSVYYFACDVADFYPTVSRHKVYWLFSKKLQCSREVSETCAKLCTRGGRLAQGLITSPIIADQLMSGPDRRIGRLCDKLGEESGSPVIYTRFVDDLTISAKFPLDSGTTPKIVLNILNHYGFVLHPDKTAIGRLSEGGRVTKLRIKRGRIDVSPEFLDVVRQQISDSALLAAGLKPAGPYYYTEQQILGRIHFIGWINQGRLGGLLRDYNSVDWSKVEAAAFENGLVAIKKHLRKRRNASSHEKPSDRSSEVG